MHPNDYLSLLMKFESFCGQKRIFISGRLSNRGDTILCSVEGMTSYVKFIIILKDCLVMKKIGNRPITKADTDFSRMSAKN